MNSQQINGPLKEGIFAGGNAQELQEHLKLSWEEILYLGDHIYGDVLQLKKNCQWRAAMVMEEISYEIDILRKNQKDIDQIDQLMKEKEFLEKQIRVLKSQSVSIEKLDQCYKKMTLIDEKLGPIIEAYEKKFNPYWGPVMRSGQEESRIMGQIMKYACIYMSKISDFDNVFANHYFRPPRRPLPHEL